VQIKTSADCLCLPAVLHVQSLYLWRPELSHGLINSSRPTNIPASSFNDPDMTPALPEVPRTMTKVRRSCQLAPTHLFRSSYPLIMVGTTGIVLLTKRRELFEACCAADPAAWGVLSSVYPPPGPTSRKRKSMIDIQALSPRTNTGKPHTAATLSSALRSIRDLARAEKLSRLSGREEPLSLPKAKIIFATSQSLISATPTAATPITLC